jgi:hypothetical protein
MKTRTVKNTNNRNRNSFVKLESKRMGTSWSKMTRGKQTNGGPKKTEAEKQAAKEAATATATQTTPSSEEAAMKQEAKRNEELIADWDEMYVGVSMMLSVSTCNSRKALVECCSFLFDINNSNPCVLPSSTLVIHSVNSSCVHGETNEKTECIIVGDRG